MLGRLHPCSHKRRCSGSAQSATHPKPVSEATSARWQVYKGQLNGEDVAVKVWALEHGMGDQSAVGVDWCDGSRCSELSVPGHVAGHKAAMACPVGPVPACMQLPRPVHGTCAVCRHKPLTVMLTLASLALLPPAGQLPGGSAAAADVPKPQRRRVPGRQRHRQAHADGHGGVPLQLQGLATLRRVLCDKQHADAPTGYLVAAQPHETYLMRCAPRNSCAPAAICARRCEKTTPVACYGTPGMLEVRCRLLAGSSYAAGHPAAV